MSLSPRLLSVLDKATAHNRPVNKGQVRGLLGVSVEVEGLHAGIGDLCSIATDAGPVLAEVVGFRAGVSIIMPLEEMAGIAPFDVVTCHGQPLSVPVGNSLLGRVIDALGRPLDGGPPILASERPVLNSAPPAMLRNPVEEPVETGVSSIDGFLTCGRGQRLGIFAGSGVGKSTLMGMIARGGMAEVNVIALVGERGREVREFIDKVLQSEGMAKTVVIVATSDMAPMLRFKAPFTAVTVAESFREQGKHVMFMMDSVTRFAGAAREIGLAAGEPPTLRGYPPSLFAHLPRLVERLGNDAHGSITGLITVLVDGDDLNEPVSDALRGYLDGHIVLSRQVAARGRFPAVDVLGSVSRLMPSITTKEHMAAAQKLRELLAHYEENRDLVQVGAYRKGSDPLLDRAILCMEALELLLYQGVENRSMAETLQAMELLAESST